MLDQERPIFFLHIPKTAGTSVISMLRTRCNEAVTLHLSWSHLVELDQPPPAKLDHYRFVAAHAGYDFISRFARRPIVITFLREPIDRAVSVYYYMRTWAAESFPDNQFRRDMLRAKDLTLLDFVTHEPEAAARHLGSVQTWFLAQDNDQPRLRMHITDETLDLAKEHLLQCEFIGLAEHMDESLALLCYALQLEPFAQPVHENLTPGRPRVSDLDDATLAALTTLVGHDLELYRFAQTLFDERWGSMLKDLLRTHARHGPKTSAMSQPAPSSTCFTFDQAITGAGWYGRQRMGGAWYSWTGPGTEAWLDLRVIGNCLMLLRFRVVHVLVASVLDSLEVLVNDVSMICKRVPDSGGIRFEALVPAAVVSRSDHRVRLTLRVPTLIRPTDLDPTSTDGRLLGIAVDRVELVPVDQGYVEMVLHGQEVVGLQAEVDHLHAEVARRDAELVNQGVEAAQAHTEAARRHQEVDRLHAEVARRDTELTSLRAEAAIVHTEAARLHVEVDRLHAEVARRDTELTSLRARAE